MQMFVVLLYLGVAYYISRTIFSGKYDLLDTMKKRILGAGSVCLLLAIETIPYLLFPQDVRQLPYLFELFFGLFLPVAAVGAWVCQKYKPELIPRLKKPIMITFLGFLVLFLLNPYIARYVVPPKSPEQHMPQIQFRDPSQKVTGNTSESHSNGTEEGK